MMKQTIQSDTQYHETLATAYDLMNKGEANLSQKELDSLKEMAIAAEAYEDDVLGLKPTNTHT